MTRRYASLAFWLLVLGVVLHFGWRGASAQFEGHAWNASQALLTFAAIALVASAYRTKDVLLSCGLLAVWQIMTVGCSIAYMVKPFATEPGKASCSAALDLPVGLLSCALALLLLAHLLRPAR